MIFDVTPDHIERLSDEDLRTLVGRLAEQEVTRAGHSPSCVTYGGHQDAKDGGIDVRVDLGSTPIRGYIPKPKTGFQVKAEDMPKSSISEEMRPSGALRTSILELGENGGAYIIVSSRGSLADKALAERKNAMSAALADAPSASGLSVDFYDRQRLASWVNQHPGLVAWVRSRVGLPVTGWQPFGDWSSSPEALTAQYLTDEHVRLIGTRLHNGEGLSATAGIEKLREILSQRNGSVRLVGLSGVGKTRLAQALFDEKLGTAALSPHIAVYADLADSPNPIPLEMMEHLQRVGQHCILIVDNCGVELHKKLCARMRGAQGSVGLLTIEYDISDDEPENTDTFRLEPASRETIEKIVERHYPTLSGPEVREIAGFSEGNSRIALALAATAEHGESLANLKDSEIIRRLVQQNNPGDPALLRAAKACSLVYSFEGEELQGDGAELPFLASLVGMSVDELHAHVAELHRRQLVQKRSSWRALLPHALAHKLAKEALQDFPAERIRKLTEAAPPRLLRSFSRRLGCLHDSREAQAIVSQWLASGGALSEVALLDELGVTILQNVSPVNPDVVLAAIERAIQDNGALTKDSLAHRLAGILRSLAYEAEAFERAIRALAVLTLSEPESRHTSAAINVFKSLFYLHLSGTHAGIVQRTDYVRSLAISKAPNRAALVLSALDALLECDHFSSSYGFEFGARKRNYGFQPTTHQECADWYRGALSLAADLAEHEYLRQPVRDMIASQFYHLAPLPGVIDYLIEIAQRFSADGGWHEGWAGVRAAKALATKHKQPSIAKKLDDLEAQLAPRTLRARIACHVLPQHWGPLDIAEIDSGDERPYEKARRKVEDICEGIGAELAADPAAFEEYLPALLDSDSARVWSVAASMAGKTQDPLRAWNAITAEITAAPRAEKVHGLPGSFLRGLSRSNKTLSEQLLNDAFSDLALHPYIVPMQANVGIDGPGCARLVAAAALNSVPIHFFNCLVGGRACDELADPDLKALLLAIAAREDGVDVALRIFQMRLFTRESEKKSLSEVEKELGRALLSKVTFAKNSQHESRLLTEIVRKCTSPHDVAVANQLCESLLQGLARGDVYAWDYGELIAELGKNFARSVLDTLLEQPSVELGPRVVFGWFRDRRPCPFRTMREAEVLDWAKEQPDTRFALIAEAIRPWQRLKHFEPNHLIRDEGYRELRWTSTALRILREAPRPKEILERYVEAFHPVSWSGSLANILESRAPLLEELTRDSDSNIAAAARAEMPGLLQRIAKARESEAQESRERDERFEW